jgi:Kef-type K+ transport system membrane component KefB
MHYLDESHILLFLLQLLVLLGLAKTLGAMCEAVKIPAIAGEIFAGIMLGPTILGRLAPDLQKALFPHEAVQSTMLETVSWLGVFFLLLASGFHVDAGRALRQGRAAVSVGLVGVVVPILIGAPVFAALGAHHWGPNANRLGFSLFLAVAASITAISVVARTMRDLKLARSEMGSMAMAACAVNDVFGWFLFTVVISIATATEVAPMDFLFTSVTIIGFVAICIAVGSRVMGHAARLVLATQLPQPAALMSLVVSAGLLCGAITQWLGIHAILGFFLAGTMAGTARHISPELRDSMSETLYAIFVPIFFATLGLKIDFVSGADLWITLLFSAVAMLGKYGGAWMGARLARLPGPTAVMMGVVFVPGGAMEIVVGTLALEMGLVRETIFVAIVFAALASSVLSGPLVAFQHRRMQTDAPAA